MDRCRSFQEELKAKDRYKVECQIGNGGNGTVVKATDLKNKQMVAIKFLERRHLFCNPRAVEENMKRLQREIIHHRLLTGHPNIIDFHEVFLTKSYLCIVMEYAEGGDLFGVVESCRNTGILLSEDEARYLFQQLIFAVNWSHKQKVVNRDIKLENALLAQQADGTWVVKLCDFGYSKHLTLNSKPRNCVGSLPYMCPEVLTANDFPEYDYDAKKAEVWSCGVCLFALLFGNFPFNTELPDLEFFEVVKSMDFKFDEDLPVSEEAKDLISFMLIEEDMRYSLEEVMQHKWFKTNLPPTPESTSRYFRQDDKEIQQIIQQALEVRNMEVVEKEQEDILNNEIFEIAYNKNKQLSSC
eukprot:TRINITY_DN6962_c0_g1_i13.p1 TRINITY_DN6962_c0_g1~~TRINITY_DN6962_c0_g1_i13.p1  ORF type:complete len:355 (+),score=46.64 TRINITY_DN6962_c0_g1_i13:115-1179(+)